jgi:hypothetical protein
MHSVGPRDPDDLGDVVRQLSQDFQLARKAFVGGGHWIHVGSPAEGSRRQRLLTARIVLHKTGSSIIRDGDELFFSSAAVAFFVAVATFILDPHQFPVWSFVDESEIEVHLIRWGW